jgi:hypothetical protein
MGCPCGARIEVPSLREIQALPTVQPPDAAGAGRRWDRRYGMLCALGVLITVVGLLLLGHGLYVRLDIDPPERREFDVALINQSIDELDSGQLWDVWANMRDEGLGAYHMPDHVVGQHIVRFYTMISVAGGVMVGVGSALALAALRLGRRR